MYTYTYPRPAVTVDAIILTDADEILLIQRGREPFQGKWALPGGFADIDETLEEACRRELLEETGISVGQLEQYRVFDAINRDPRHRTLTLAFYAFLPGKKDPFAGDDAAQAQWFSIHDLPPLAFDHELIISGFTRDFLPKVSKRPGTGTK